MNVLKQISIFYKNNLITINGFIIIINVIYTHVNLEFKHRKAESVGRVLINTREVSLFEIVSLFMAFTSVVYFAFEVLMRKKFSIRNNQNKTLNNSIIIFTISILGSLNLIVIYLVREAERRSDLIALANTNQLGNYLTPDKIILVCFFVGICNMFLSIFILHEQLVGRRIITHSQNS
jgi:hypothetical protein